MPPAATLTVNLTASQNVASGPPRPPQMPPSGPPQSSGPGAYQILMGLAGAGNPLFGALVPPPTPPPSIFQRMFQPASREARQSAAFTSMGLGMAGMSGAAGLAGGYAALGPAGVALAAVHQFSAALRQVSDSVLRPIAATDPMALGRGFADMLKYVPLVGPAMHTLSTATLGLSDALFHTAERLSEYSGPLAFQQAMNEVSTIMHDMRRAQEFGPQIQQAVDQRFQWQEMLQRALDRLLPDVIELQRSGLEVLQTITPLLVDITKTLLAIANSPGTRGVIATVFNLANPNLALAYLANVAANIARIAENTTQEPADFVAAQAALMDVLNNIQRPDPEMRFNQAPGFNPPPAFQVP